MPRLMASVILAIQSGLFILVLCRHWVCWRAIFTFENNHRAVVNCHAGDKLLKSRNGYGLGRVNIDLVLFNF